MLINKYEVTTITYTEVGGGTDWMLASVLARAYNHGSDYCCIFLFFFFYRLYTLYTGPALIRPATVVGTGRTRLCFVVSFVRTIFRVDFLSSLHILHDLRASVTRSYRRSLYFYSR